MNKTTWRYIALLIICFNYFDSIAQLNTPNSIQLRKKLIGSWQSALNNYYGELHFINDSICVPIQDSVYYHDSYFYKWIGKDTVILSISYRKSKVSISGDTLMLSFKEDKLYHHRYERIKPEPTEYSEDYYDGFVIRRCNFLASKGIISWYKAYKYLYEYIEQYHVLDTTYYNDVEEIIIPITNPDKEEDIPMKMDKK